ncbi:MAG TPA: hypothetical protein VIY47_15780, partial [Ignavibacteriaceae bacterium]
STTPTPPPPSGRSVPAYVDEAGEVERCYINELKKQLQALQTRIAKNRVKEVIKECERDGGIPFERLPLRIQVQVFKRALLAPGAEREKN